MGIHLYHLAERCGFVQITMAMMTPGLAKFEFAMGAHGLVWDSNAGNQTMVTKVSCQARLLGVQPGWTISSVNGQTVETSSQAWNELLKAKKAGKKYPVYFMKDEASIREDQ